MKKLFYRLIDVLGDRKIISIVSIILLLHLGGVLFSFNYHYQKEIEKTKEYQIGVVSRILPVMRATPEQERKAILFHVYPNSVFSKKYLSDSPKFKNRIYLGEKEALKNYLTNKKIFSDISLQIDRQSWINFHFEPPLYARWVKMTIISIGEFFLVITIFLCFFISYQFNNLLFKFREAAERLGVDLKSTPIGIDGPLSIQKVAKSVNQMQKRIQNLITGRTRMLASISHDLKTPLTRMILRAECIPDVHLQQSFNADLEEMKNMITETLAYAKEDFQAGKKTSLDLVSLLEVVCYENHEVRKEVYFASYLKKAPFIGNVLSLKRAFNNIIDNAVRYGKKARVTLYSNAEFLVIEIQDEGPGIEESEKENLFLPFRRGSADEYFPGTGLGLTIVHEIIQAHDGKISLRNLPCRGLLVKIMFPRANAHRG